MVLGKVIGTLVAALEDALRAIADSGEALSAPVSMPVVQRAA